MTDRIEAIRARWKAANRLGWPWDDDTLSLGTSDEPKVKAIAHAPEDVAWLLAEVKEARDDAAHFEAEYDDAVADLVRVAALATNWERLAATAMDPEVREWCTAAASSVRAALTPVVPDAEPGEWEWTKGDVVQDPEDGTVVAREADGTYPWRSTNGVDQRDQDITNLVTNHGGRVLICKARGIGAVTP